MIFKGFSMRVKLVVVTPIFSTKEQFRRTALFFVFITRLPPVLKINEEIVNKPVFLG